jgi:hypothetical protein
MRILQLFYEVDSNPNWIPAVEETTTVTIIIIINIIYIKFS